MPKTTLTSVFQNPDASLLPHGNEEAADDVYGPDNQKTQRLNSTQIDTGSTFGTYESRHNTIPTNIMIDAALAHPDSHEWNCVKIQRSSLLNINLNAGDPRIAIVKRNKIESSLLSLPAELRTHIFRLVQGGHHIHILSEKPTVDDFGDLPSASRRAPTGLGSVSREAQLKDSKLWNVIYPSDWRSYYRSIALAGSLDIALGRYHLAVTSSGRSMRLFSATCRQIYDEAKFLPYSENEFSFQDEFTMLSWFVNRVPDQLRVMEELFTSIEWFSRSTAIFGGEFRPFRHCGVKKIRISRLALCEFYNRRTGVWAPATWMTKPVGGIDEELYRDHCKSMLESRGGGVSLDIEFID